jgi:hypothetical protein
MVLQAHHPIGISTQRFVFVQKLLPHLFLQSLWVEKREGYPNSNEKGGQEMTPAEACAWPIIGLVGVYVIYVWVYELTNLFSKGDPK